MVRNEHGFKPLAGSGSLTEQGLADAIQLMASLSRPPRATHMVFVESKTAMAEMGLTKPGWCLAREENEVLHLLPKEVDHVA